MKRFKEYIKEITNPIINTPNFKKWFGKSKAIDKAGNPLMVYHGTSKKVFKRFSKDSFGSSTDAGWLGEGFYFSSDPTVANVYAGRGINSRHIPVYLRIEKPFSFKGINSHTFIKEKGGAKAFTKWAKSKGYDGVIERYIEGTSQYVAFEPNQIKSAIGNNGNFSNTSDNLNEQYIAERKQVGKLYHYTSFRSLLKILQLNHLLGQRMAHDSNITLYGVSTTRNKNFHKKSNKDWQGYFIKNGIPLDVRITLNGDKLSDKYPIRPFDYYKGKTKDVEMEEIIDTNGKNNKRWSSGLVDDIKKYIVAIDTRSINDDSIDLNTLNKIKKLYPKLGVLK